MPENKVQEVIKVVSIILIAILGVSCLLVYQILRQGCFWWECMPQRNFTVFDLNLPKAYFPLGADIHDLHPLRGDGVSVEAASTTNYWDNGLAIYIVRRFATTSRAIRHYEYDTQFNFTRQSVDTDYASINSYSSNLADTSVVQCGYIQDDFRCIYVARYEEFTVFFSGSIGDNEMTEQDFLRVLTYIDDKTASLLEVREK